MTLLSIIVPCYNQEANVLKAWNSIYSQHEDDYEVLFCNDGSTDNTLLLLNAIAKNDKSSFVINHDNKGYGYTVNDAIDMSSGQYIAILEPDDIMTPSAIENMKHALSESNAIRYNIDVVKFMYFVKDKYGTKICRLKSDFDNLFYDVKSGYLKNEDRQPLLMHHPSIWSAIYRKSFLFGDNAKHKKIEFEEAKGAGWVDNRFLYETILLANKLKVSSNSTIVYNLDQDSNSMRVFDKDVPFDRMFAVKQFLNSMYGVDNWPDYIKDAYEFRVKQYIWLVTEKYKIANIKDISDKISVL